MSILQRALEALENATTSLKTISTNAGMNDCMSDAQQTRGYANSRYLVAQNDLSKLKSETTHVNNNTPQGYLIIRKSGLQQIVFDYPKQVSVNVDSIIPLYAIPPN